MIDKTGSNKFFLHNIAPFFLPHFDFEIWTIKYTNLKCLTQWLYKYVYTHVTTTQITILKIPSPKEFLPFPEETSSNFYHWRLILLVFELLVSRIIECIIFCVWHLAQHNFWDSYACIIKKNFLNCWVAFHWMLLIYSPVDEHWVISNLGLQCHELLFNSESWTGMRLMQLSS